MERSEDKPGVVLSIGNFARERVRQPEETRGKEPITVVGIPRIMEMIERIARTDATVLINGQTGTGKEVVARKIHELSERKNEPFVVVNCAAIPEGLFESEIFGHESGAFTGAFARHEGMFEQANGGTFVLDEIGSMPLPMQVKLLNIIQDKRFARVGGTKEVKVDVRIIALSNTDLREAIRQNTFREDLFYRLNVISIDVPNLGSPERIGEIPDLVAAFVQKYGEKKGITAVDDETMAILMEDSWPGNVRELENIIAGACIFCDATIISQTCLPDDMQTINSSERAYRVAERIKKIRAAMRKTVHADILAGDKAFAKALSDMMETGDPAPVLAIAQSAQAIRWQIRRLYAHIFATVLESQGGVKIRAAELLEVDRSNLHKIIKGLGSGNDENE